MSIWIGVRGRLHVIASFSSRTRRSVASASAPMPGRSHERRAAATARVGDEIDLDLGVGRDDRADVAALDDDVALLPERALPLAHHLAHGVVARDDGDELVDVGLADRGRSRRAGDEDPAALVELDRVLGRELGELGGAVERQPRWRASQVSARYIAPVSR